MQQHFAAATVWNTFDQVTSFLGLDPRGRTVAVGPLSDELGNLLRALNSADPLEAAFCACRFRHQARLASLIQTERAAETLEIALGSCGVCDAGPVVRAVLAFFQSMSAEGLVTVTGSGS